MGKEIHPEAEEGVGVVETEASAEEVGVEMVEVESLDLALKVEDLVVVLEVKRVMAVVMVILGAVMVGAVVLVVDMGSGDDGCWGERERQKKKE